MQNKILVLTLIFIISFAGYASANCHLDSTPKACEISSPSPLLTTFTMASNSEVKNNKTNVFIENVVVKHQGCCSHHSGVCGCDNGRAACCDGTDSPSCGCD